MFKDYRVYYGSLGFGELPVFCSIDFFFHQITNRLLESATVQVEAAFFEVMEPCDHFFAKKRFFE